MSEVKGVMNAVFGQYLKQPLHETLRQMRLASIIAIIFCGHLLYEMWLFYSAVADINNGGDVGFWGFAVAILGAFWKAVNSLTDRHEKD